MRAKLRQVPTVVCGKCGAHTTHIMTDIGTCFATLAADVSQRTVVTAIHRNGRRCVEVWTRNCAKDDFTLRLDIPVANITKFLSSLKEATQ